MAMRSREIWLQLLESAGLPYKPTGSLHVMYRKDEEAVAREFAELAPGLGYDCRWLNAYETLQLSSALIPQGLRGALWSPAELTVDPRAIIDSLPGYLEDTYGVQFHFGCAVRAIDGAKVHAGTGVWKAERVIVCGGDDFATLYPEVFAGSGIRRCKLQMLRTVPQPDDWQLGPSLAGGLTLQHYPAFGICTTLPALKRRIAEETPELNKWGIHILVSQTARGEITIGDSHEYGDAVNIFDKLEIDHLILDHSECFLRLPDSSLAERWHGVYAKHPDKPFFTSSPAGNVRIVTATGGAGMTLSFGLAEQTCNF